MLVRLDGVKWNLWRLLRTAHLICWSDHMPNKNELGPNSAGQSGDTQQLSDLPDADSQSVEELLEEGDAFEAEVVDGVEDASSNADVAEVTTHEVPEDDVPEEYRDQDRERAS
jgi:hypothetical protein